MYLRLKHRSLFTVFQLQTELPEITFCFLSRKKPSHQFIIYRVTGRLLSFSARIWWLTESKALLKSIANIRTALHLGSSRNLQILFWISSKAFVQLLPSLYANSLSSSCSSTGRWAWTLYTAFSRALAMTGVTLITRKSPLATGTSTFGNGLIFALFHDLGYWCVARDKFQSLVIIGVKISAWSFHTQYGIWSRPVAVFFRLLNVFHIYRSLISGASTSGPISTYARST